MTLFSAAQYFNHKYALILCLSLSLTGCGINGFGVLRNPLSGPPALVNSGSLNGGQTIFDGNPAELQTLYLSLPLGARLSQGEKSQLQLIALDKQGRRIDPSKLNLTWKSSRPDVLAVDKGALDVLFPLQNSVISVVDANTGIATDLLLQTTVNSYEGNPGALVSLQLVQKNLLSEPNGKVQFQLIAKDTTGRLIDPAKLKLVWESARPDAFQVAPDGTVTVLVSQGSGTVTVKEQNSGKETSGTVMVPAIGQPPVAVIPTTPGASAPGSSGQMPGPNPAPVPPNPPNPPSTSVPVSPTTPSEVGDPNDIVSLTLGPASVLINKDSQRALEVVALDSLGRRIDPSQLNLQWTSSVPGAFNVNNGTVTSTTPSGNAVITVSVPGKNLTASSYVSTASSGGGGGGGGGSTLPLANPPMGQTSPTTTTSFQVQLTPPQDSSPSSYTVVVNGHTFTVPAGSGPLIYDIPSSAGLQPDTSYPVSVIANYPQGAAPQLDLQGATLPDGGGGNAAPVHLLGGSHNFSGTQQGTTGKALVFSAATGNALQVADAATDVVTVTLTSATGVLTLSSTATVGGLSEAPTGSGTSTLILKGTPAAVNAALAGLAYSGSSGSLSISSVDNHGAGPTTHAVTLVMNTASAPVNGLNGQSDFNQNQPVTPVNTPITLNVSTAAAVTVSDANGDTLTVTLTPQQGRLTVNQVPSGVMVGARTHASQPLVLTGKPEGVNKALESLTYTPNVGYVGNADIAIVTSDGALSDQDTLRVVVTQPGVLWSKDLVFPTTAVGPIPQSSAAPLNQVEIAGFTGTTTVTLSVPAGSGVLTLPGAMGSGISNTVTLSGTQAQINAVLASLTYTPSGTAPAHVDLTVNATDGTLNQTKTLPITVNSPPVNSLTVSGSPVTSHTLTVTEALTFGQGSYPVLSVADSDSPSLTVTLSSSGGVLSGLSAGTSNNVTITANPGGGYTLVGSPADINSLLGAVVYTPSVPTGGSVTLSSNDGQNTAVSSTLNIPLTHTLAWTGPTTGPILRGSDTSGAISLQATPTLVPSGNLPVGGSYRVDFYVGTTKVGESTTAVSGVYRYDWTPTYATMPTGDLSARLVYVPPSPGTVSELVSTTGTTPEIKKITTASTTPVNGSIFNIGRDDVPLSSTVPEIPAGGSVAFVITPDADGPDNIAGNGDDIEGFTPTIEIPASVTAGAAIATFPTGTGSGFDGNDKADGKYTLQVIVKDSGGNTVHTSDSQTFDMVYFGYNLYGVVNAVGTATGTAVGDVYRISSNPGRTTGTYEKLTNNLPGVGNAIDKDPRNGNIIYANGNKLTVWDPRTGQVIRQWDVTGSGSPSQLGVSDTHPGLVYFPVGGGLREVNILDGSGNYRANGELVPKAYTVTGVSGLSGGDLAFEPGTGTMFMSVGNALYWATFDPLSATTIAFNTLTTINPYSATTGATGHTNPAGIGFDAKAHRVIVNPRIGNNENRLYSVNYTRSGAPGSYAYTFVNYDAFAIDHYGLLFGDLTSAHGHTLPSPPPIP
jgi:hypothetical protein